MFLEPGTFSVHLHSLPAKGRDHQFASLRTLTLRTHYDISERKGDKQIMYKFPERGREGKRKEGWRERDNRYHTKG